MLNSTDTFKTTMISPSAQVYIKLELMDQNENIIDELSQSVNKETVGNVSVDGTRDIQRMFELELDNDSGDFTWGETSNIWLNKRVKLYIGLMVGSSVEYIPQGLFIISAPESGSISEGSYTTKLSGHDKAYLFTGNLGKFVNATTVTTGTNIRTAIQTILTAGGETKYILDACSETVPYDITWQPGENRWKAMKELAELAVYTIYYDVNGYFRFKPEPTLENSPVVWTYNKTANPLYAGSIRKLDDEELFNHIVVLGGSGQTATVRSELLVDNTLSDWTISPFAYQLIGKRTFQWNDGNPDPLITTQSQADARALFELKKRLAYNERVSIELAPNYLHEAGDVIIVEDSKNGTTGKYELVNFNVPINAQVTTAEALRVRSVFA